MLEARPPLDEPELEVVRALLEREQREHPAYASAWRQIGVQEANAPYARADEDGYALSPRSTRGAKRA